MAAWCYFTVWLIDGRLYAFFARSVFISFFINIVRSFAPFGLHSWRMDGSVIAMVSVPGLCIVTPFSPEWKIVV